ncbi:hypothetical protein QCA50_011617 [Cerrena zonata]|uniref:Uncharacterized protein n=1 Tax=Cerrena zonata TaxID=2478898 RepID=A0AAW0G4M6_9APHY
MVQHFAIKKKAHIATARLVIEAFLYDCVRHADAAVKPKKFGFLTEVTPKRLYGQKNWAVLRPLVKANMEAKGDGHWIGAYSRVITEKWEAEDINVCKAFTISAKQVNDRNGTVEMKALYGNSCFKQFCETVTCSAEKWFGAVIVMVTTRPNINNEMMFNVIEPSPAVKTQ